MCNWLYETEEDNLLYDFDDTDNDSDYIYTNTCNTILKILYSKIKSKSLLALNTKY